MFKNNKENLENNIDDIDVLSNDLMLNFIPLRDVVVFPRVIMPLFVAREKSIKTIEKAMSENKKLLLVTQKVSEIEEPKKDDLYEVGVYANILQYLKLPDGTVKLLIEGEDRVKVKSIVETKDFAQAEVEFLKDEHLEAEEKELNILSRSVIESFKRYAKLKPEISLEILNSVDEINDYTLLIDALVVNLNMKVEDKQNILELESNFKRLEAIYVFVEKELDFVRVDRRIRYRVKQQIDKNQKEFYLNEQIKAIQKELGEDENEMDELTKKVTELPLSKEAEKKAKSELRKLKKTSPMSAEGTVIRNYLDWILDLPWGKKTKASANLNKAKEILDKEHYALEKVKERILEYLAVQKRVGTAKGSILCFIGPPGVGKTSLSKTIAKAIGRNFVRVSLGGVKDESEIRGHRRTYIGSMPGRIIQSIKKSGSSNPLMLLDEIDKMGNDWKGDPTSAMLEVLDPEQNNSFSDHYLDVDYDLSDVMFITTANSYDIPRPLLDRMEIINLSGYTEEEKVEIAKRHIIPKELISNGLKEGEWSITDESLLDLIRHYTKESGVRNLDRKIASLMRKAVKELSYETAPKSKTLFKMDDDKKSKKAKSIKVTLKNLAKYAGVKKFSFGKSEEENEVGLVTGLAWTQVGGELLSIESISMKGKGKCILTGKLGDVMKESIHAAYSFIRSNATDFGIHPKLFDKKDIHVHVPEGATPKDGPSAGIAMCTTIVSMLTQIPVRKDVAMTGEVTLRGRVLPIGGLKEKLLAALRGGIKTVIIPKENAKDLEELPKNVIENLEIIPVSDVKEVFKIALTKPLKKIKVSDDELEESSNKKSEEE